MQTPCEMKESAWCYAHMRNPRECLKVLQQEHEEKLKEATEVWIYYETDGDAGWYDVTLFKTKQSAENYKKAFGNSAYGKVEQIAVTQPLPFEG